MRFKLAFAVGSSCIGSSGGLHLFGLRFGGLGNVRDLGGCDDLVFGLLLKSAGSPGIFGDTMKFKIACTVGSWCAGGLRFGFLGGVEDHFGGVAVGVVGST